MSLLIAEIRNIRGRHVHLRPNKEGEGTRPVASPDEALLVFSMDAYNKGGTSPSGTEL